ncbi:hypothetical protein CDAR_445931 [Caerostris darwini]|uniref:Uncharacterized protein n=1 Tax=Caerostris darwini TaxID=1538125 RepID=A0AAV4U0G3_9ARAC|nr:hypothetical protein CDAR_445931 [Caerostris darwini]
MLDVFDCRSQPPKYCTFELNVDEPFPPGANDRAKEGSIFMASSKTYFQTIFIHPTPSFPSFPQLERRLGNAAESVNYDLISSSGHMQQTIIKFE